MSVVITGGSGQLGSELSSRLPDAIVFSREKLNVASADSISQNLEAIKPSLIINCAAYNQVDLAEKETVSAWQGNAIAPKNLADFAASHHCKLVHLSTDFVFGQNRQRNIPYTENDAPGPVSVYGTTKLAGEHFVLAASPNHLVIRTCGLYGSRGKGNFVKTMLRLAGQGKPIAVVNDQICAPTSIVDLADAVLALIDSEAIGLYHFNNAGKTTWYDFAQQIFELTKTNADLSPISSQQFGADAKRPCYSLLDCGKYQQTTGKKIQTIDEALRAYLHENDAESI